MCAEHNIPVTPFEKEHPFLLHAKLGAYVARAKYGITDEEILSSPQYWQFQHFHMQSKDLHTLQLHH